MAGEGILDTMAATSPDRPQLPLELPPIFPSSRRKYIHRLECPWVLGDGSECGLYPQRHFPFGL